MPSVPHALCPGKHGRSIPQWVGQCEAPEIRRLGVDLHFDGEDMVFVELRKIL